MDINSFFLKVDANIFSEQKMSHMLAVNINFKINEWFLSAGAHFVFLLPPESDGECYALYQAKKRKKKQT